MSGYAGAASASEPPASSPPAAPSVTGLETNPQNERLKPVNLFDLNFTQKREKDFRNKWV